jgi:hypothetical protein
MHTYKFHPHAGWHVRDGISRHGCATAQYSRAFSASRSSADSNPSQKYMIASKVGFTYAYMYVWNVRMYACMYACVHVCMRVYMYACR